MTKFNKDKKGLKVTIRGIGEGRGLAPTLEATYARILVFWTSLEAEDG